MSMLRSVVHDLRAVLIPYLLPILNFSVIPGVYGLSVFLWISPALCVISLSVFLCCQCGGYLFILFMQIALI